MTIERRTVSAGTTLLAKVISVIWIVGFGLGTFAMVVTGVGRSGAPTLEFVALWLVGSAFLSWSTLRLKKITIDGDLLEVSNYLRVASIPISQVSSVMDAAILPNLWVIVVHFRSPSAFGKKVIFWPSSRTAVRVLREAVAGHAGVSIPNEV